MLTADQFIAAGHAADVRAGDPQRDPVDGVVPALVVEPFTADAVAATLAWASDRRLAVLIEGAGSKRAWGRRPGRLDMILSLRRLNNVLVHRHGDLTVTVAAGVPLRELNAALGARGQQLPLDPPAWHRATVGGVLATNDSGPLRQRFGAPRDLVIGIQLATTDGRLTHAGGQVVKNVAGYDLSKLACGSFGTLAAIVSATFKLSPLPPASTTLVLQADSAGSLAAVAAAIAASQLEPAAFEYHAVPARGGTAGTMRCLLRFASAPAAIEAMIAAAARHAAAAGLRYEAVRDDEERRIWDAHEPRADAASSLVRVGWLPADAGRLFALLERLAASVDVEFWGRAAVGAGVIRMAGGIAEQAAAVAHLRQSSIVGNVAVRSAPAAVKALVDVWGPRTNGPLLDAVKRTLDPNDTLGAGRGI